MLVFLDIAIYFFQGAEIVVWLEDVVRGSEARLDITPLEPVVTGLVPDSGGTWLLPRLVGQARAAGLALLGERIDAGQAEAWGMIWKCVDDERLREEADTLTRHLACQPTLGLGLVKCALQASAGNTLDQQLDLECDLQRRAGRSEDYREGVAAFVEKRKPRFTGQ